MRSYRAFGLTFASSIDLPELTEVDAPPDVRISLGFAGVPDAAWHSGRQSWGEPGVSWVFQPAWGAIRIESGSLMTVEMRGGLTEAGIRVWLLGPAMAILLHQRGFLVLHGSAIDAGGRAAVFLGASGAGKSTTAYGLARQGMPVVSDDIVPVEFFEGAPVVRPGIPHLRLAPSVLTESGEPPDRHPAPIPWDEKRHVQLGQASLAAHLPLGGVYLLEQATALSLDTLSPQQSFAALARNSFLAPLMVQSNSLAWHLEACARLASASRLRRLAFPRRLDCFPQLAPLIHADLHPPC
ncbi:MAG TPA: hypothetical protein PLF84_16590 [Bryobacteraceae bacterium]|nr:hypothetical protein [Bryobacterales bacterium]HRJ20671.1 hypothetical protein [Bryobacteraceae bacterium]